jgi:hypothetical protein
VTTLNLTFTMDNAAFEPDPWAEAIRILDAVALLLANEESGGAILDANGNRVGSWEIEL